MTEAPAALVTSLAKIVGESHVLTDPSLRLVPAPTPGLGRPTAVYHVGRIAMYVYPYDLATRIVSY